MEVVRSVYQLTDSFPKLEKFGLISQIQRAVVSIPSNIAEGSGKSSNKDFCRFLEISLGSSFELETLIILATDLKYIDNNVSTNIQKSISELQKMIFGFKQKLS